MNKSLFLGVFVLLALVACKRDEPDPGKSFPAPTPYQLQQKPFFPPYVIPADNPLTVEGISLGRHLFYETKLSGDNTQSCASCHTQDLAFTDHGLRFSTGITGAVGTRNSMALFNLSWSNRFFWDGRVATLRQQVLLPIEDPIEMHESLPNAINKLKQTNLYPDLFGHAFGTEEITADRMAKALEQFLLSLVSTESKFDLWRRNPVLNPLTESEQRGFNLFMREFSPPGSGRPAGADCFHCHGTHLFTVNGFFNNGLDENPATGFEIVTGSAMDRGKFKAPSLRNIALTAPYMHDGRFETLEEVIDHYNDGLKDSPTIDVNLKSQGVGLGLSQQDKHDLISFLHTLTDTVFLNNPAFSNPFN
ncbi:MAG: cytochrome-c peroxidase [Bacteroidia bacterium]